MLGLILFLDRFSSKGKTKDAGQAVLFLKTGDFFQFSVPQGVELDSVAELSSTLGVDFTSDFVGVTVNIGGGENSHLSSLKNAWEECRGVAGGVFNPSSKGSSFISGEGITGLSLIHI